MDGGGESFFKREAYRIDVCAMRSGKMKNPSEPKRRVASLLSIESPTVSSPLKSRHSEKFNV
jgi:hypothetical protein